MERKVVQDIVPANRRSIRAVSTPTSAIRTAPRMAPETPRRVPPPPIRSTPPGKKRRASSLILTFLVIFVAIAVIAVALSLLYSKAAVTITPKRASFDVNTTVTAQKAVEGSASSPSSLSYDIVTSTQSLSETIPATDGPLIQTKAKGTVTLYNEQTVQQKLVAGTRLANADGDVYRTLATLVIPAGKAGAPGSVAGAVLADQAGAQYNMSMNDDLNFKIVAYQGTPKYSTVYAKAKTAMTGGFSGTKKSILPETKKAAEGNLKKTLAAKLLADAQANVPAGSVLFDKAYTIEYEVPEPVSKGADSAEVTVKGVFTGAVFKKTALVKTIAAKEIDKFPAASYEVEGMDELDFTVVNAKDFSAKKGTPLIFTLEGPLTLTGTFSESALKNELKGTYLKDSNAVFSRYPAIANAYALITPFWMRSFPNSPDKILLEIKD